MVLSAVAVRRMMVFSGAASQCEERDVGNASVPYRLSTARDEKTAPERASSSAAGMADGHYQGTKRLWPKVIAKADLPGVTPHTLRHTMSSTAVSTGEALALTGAILGHANVRSTALYAHVRNDPSRRAADRVSNWIAAALAGDLPSRRVARSKKQPAEQNPNGRSTAGPE